MTDTESFIFHSGIAGGFICVHGEEKKGVSHSFMELTADEEHHK